MLINGSIFSIGTIFVPNMQWPYDLIIFVVRMVQLRNTFFSSELYVIYYQHTSKLKMYFEVVTVVFIRSTFDTDALKIRRKYSVIE